MPWPHSTLLSLAVYGERVVVWILSRMPIHSVAVVGIPPAASRLVIVLLRFSLREGKWMKRKWSMKSLFKALSESFMGWLISQALIVGVVMSFERV